MYDNASRLRCPNRDKPAATRVRAVKCGAEFLLEIARGGERARVAMSGRSLQDVQSAAGLRKSVSADNRHGLLRFADEDSIQPEVVWRFVWRLTNTRARGLLFGASILRPGGSASPKTMSHQAPEAPTRIIDAGNVNSSCLSDGIFGRVFCFLRVFQVDRLFRRRCHTRRERRKYFVNALRTTRSTLDIAAHAGANC